MNSQTLGLCAASALFGLISVAQLARLVIRPEIIVAGYRMPLWSSAPAFPVLAGLSIWMCKLACGQTK